MASRASRECSSLRRPRVFAPTRSLRVNSSSRPGTVTNGTPLPAVFASLTASTMDMGQVSDPSPPSPPREKKENCAEGNAAPETALIPDSKSFEKMQNDIQQLSIRLNELQAQLRAVGRGATEPLTRAPLPVFPTHSTVESMDSSSSVFPPPPLQVSRILLHTGTTDESPTPPPRHLFPFSPPTVPPRTYKKKGAPPKPQRTFLESPASLTGSLTLTRLSSAVHREEFSNKWSAVLTVDIHSEDFNARTLSEDIKSAFQKDTCWFEIERLLLFVNPFNDLSSKRKHFYSAIGKMAVQALAHHEHSVLFFGDSGSGKSYLAEQLVLAIHARALAKIRRSPLTRSTSSFPSSLLPSLFLILNSFTSVQTAENNRASRIVHWYEVLVREGRTVRLRMHHFFGDATSLAAGAANVYRLIGSQLSDDEADKYFIRSLRNSVGNDEHTAWEDRMTELRVALTTLCFHWDDIVRVLAACHLLENLKFKAHDDQLDILPQRVLENIACLLGVSSLSLYKVLTKRITTLKSERVSAEKTEASAAFERTRLVTAIYTRLVAAILRRMNAILDLMADDQSNAGVQNVQSPIDDRQGLCSTNQAASSAISVFDCFGMSRPSKKNGFEELCTNIIVEKNFQFFLTNMSSPDVEVLLDVVPCVESAVLDDFLMPDFGIFYVLDDECEASAGSTRHFLHTVAANKRHMKKVTVERESLVVKHFEDARTVAYDCTRIVEKNRNALRPEAVEIFSDESCSFTFAVSLFRFDREAWKEGRGSAPRVIVDAGAAPVGDATLTEQLVARFDSLAIRGSRSHMQLVHCSKSNVGLEYACFDSQHVKEQLHAWTIPRLALGHSASTSTGPANVTNIPTSSTSSRAATRTSISRAPSLGEIKPPLPLERNYTIKNGRKLAFPQRRTVVSNHQDVSSGVSLRAGQALKATAFTDSGKSLLVETARGLAAQIPTHLTKLTLPPAYVV